MPLTICFANDIVLYRTLSNVAHNVPELDLQACIDSSHLASRQNGVADDATLAG
jgi:hypothetical protein